MGVCDNFNPSHSLRGLCNTCGGTRENHVIENTLVYTDYSKSKSGAKREKLHTTPYDQPPYQEFTEAFSRVAEFGVTKYGAWNWSAGLPRIQILGSLLRHIFAYIRGEEFDKETGLSHTDHILWNATVLSHNVHWNLEDGRRVEPHRDYKENDNVTKSS